MLKHRKMSREDAQKLAVEMLHRVGIDDPAAWAARLLEWRRDHGLDPALDAGVWLAWADWSLSRLRYRAAYADVQAALELRPGWPPAVELRRRIELRAGTHGLL